MICPPQHRPATLRALRESLRAVATECARLADALEHELERPRSALLVRTAGALLERVARS